ncbi:prepilin-type N-terminal cleavage/methylation domain-containing protein [Patescibacteria group bacterium]|nr:prepilin-type N-terminal cleavage/methylation domain-containing protein [Patescibacteria group bacterium]
MNNQRGFGLIEVTVSIYILTMGLFGLMSLLHQSLKAQDINKNSIVAAQLAQEGIELVRNVRDNNWLDPDSSDWKIDIVDGKGGDANQAFAIDYRGRDNIQPVSSIDDENSKLYIDVDNFYTHDSSSNSPTLFSRIIEKINSNNEYVEIISTVKWSERGADHDYVVATKLYNWRFASR